MKYLLIILLGLMSCAKKPDIKGIEEPTPPVIYEALAPIEDTTPEPVTEPESPFVGTLPVIYFDFDSKLIKGESLQKMRVLFDKMGNSSCMVEGHTCRIGTDDYNLGLGEARAASVRDWLQAAGVGRARLKIISYGEERPVSDRLELNRRVEVKCQ